MKSRRKSRLVTVKIMVGADGAHYVEAEVRVPGLPTRTERTYITVDEINKIVSGGTIVNITDKVMVVEVVDKQGIRNKLKPKPEWTHLGSCLGVREPIGTWDIFDAGKSYVLISSNTSEFPTTVQKDKYTEVVKWIRQQNLPQRLVQLRKLAHSGPNSDYDNIMYHIVYVARVLKHLKAEVRGRGLMVYEYTAPKFVDIPDWTKQEENKR